MRDPAAIGLARLAAAGSRLLGAGGGTTLPGRLALGVAPGIAGRVAGRLPRGAILVSGTNGKTTTARLLGGILTAAGWRVIHNRAGANLLSGIASALLERTSLAGRPAGDAGLFEVDEFTLPAAVDALRPAAVVLLNLFRDQLDRYGEIDLIADRWRRALAGLPEGATVVYNGDDPMVADVGAGFAGRAVTFGVEDAPGRGGGARTLEHAADARYCYRCGVLYVYTLVTLGHMGHYRCPQCGTARPAADIRAEQVRLHGADGATLTIAVSGARSPAGEDPRVPPTAGTVFAVRSALPGLYNVYNVTAAAAAGVALGVAPAVVANGIATTAPAFGRGERVAVDGRELVFLLAKNPAGFNEVLRTVLLAAEAPVVVIAINDLIADGRDISWLWDVDFEMLRDRARGVVVTGVRADDMALRLKYAGVPAHRVTVEPDGWRALAAGLAQADGAGPVYVLPTYTAMLHLRALLARKGYVRGFWKQ